MTWKFEIAKLLYPQVFEDKDRWRQEAESMQVAKNLLVVDKDVLTLENIELKKQLTHTEKPVNDFEQFCDTHFKEVSKFAYKDKGIFKDIRYSMYPNELIQPELFVVQQIKNSIQQNANFLSWVGNVAKDVDGRLKWVSDEDTDNTLDAYQDTYATIFSPLQDCEQHAALVCSIEPRCGLAFGFAGKTGHAFGVCVYRDELYVIETNNVNDRNRNAKVIKYDGQSQYKIHWIFTQNKTYQCTAKPVHFGYKAQLR